MKRVFLFICLLITTSFGCYAQFHEPNVPVLLASGMKLPFSDAIKGGKDGKIYQVIVKTDKTKSEIIDVTAKFLQSMNIVKSEKVLAALDNVNEEMTEYVLPMEFHTGIGVHGGSVPLIISANCRFEFYEGGVKLSVEDLDEEFFLIHKTKTDPLTPTDNMNKYNEFSKDASRAAGATSKFGKFIAKTDKILEIDHVQGSIGEFFKIFKDKVQNKIAEADQQRLTILENYRNSVETQENFFNKMISDGDARWYSLEKYIEMIKDDPDFNKYPKAAENSLKNYQKALEEHKLYDLPEKRWNRDVRYIYDGIFISLANFLEGTIEGVAEDGVQTWIREGELVVPTDPKTKAKYLKKKKSFTDFESYDN